MKPQRSLAVSEERFILEKKGSRPSKVGKASSDSCSVNQALVDHFRCPNDLLDFDVSGPLSADAGYFRFGSNLICYGTTASGSRAKRPDDTLYDALDQVTARAGTTRLPFSPTEVIDNLRLERYTGRDQDSSSGRWKQSLKDVYYFARPFLRDGVRRHIQRAHLTGWQTIPFPRWPVDTTVEDLCERLLLLSMKAKGLDSIPFIWFWPDGARGCMAMTHDVETQTGKDFCSELMSIDESFGIKASFQLIPEGRYEVSEHFIGEIRGRGFEVDLQDLNHDGNLFRERSEFLRRAGRINHYAKNFGISGFRSGILYRNLNWYEAFQFSFDMSVPNVAHLDPQRGGCCTVLPYFIGNILEIPVTTTQDYMLFNLLGDYSLDLWRAQVELILRKNGLASFIVHPDYILEKKANAAFHSLLTFLMETRSRDKVWFSLPGEIDQWWRARSKMSMVNLDGCWKIQGPGSEKARVAFANLVDDHIEYTVAV